MKFLAVILSALLVAGLTCNDASAQIIFNDTYQLTPVNGGTGSIVSIPIGSSGLSVSVGTGSASLPLQNIAGAPGAEVFQLGDDSAVNVPLGFNFPYWGQSFNNSWMYSNGIVSFKDGNIPGAGCCEGQNLQHLANTRQTAYNYAIIPLWADLVDNTGQTTWVLKNSSSATYGWYGTNELGSNNYSSFEVNINASGSMNVRYGSAVISPGRMVTSGMTGNLERGEFFQYYHGSGLNISSTNPVTWGSSGLYTYDACAANPLSSPSCPGYTAAYTTQQCSVNSLYDQSCPGYAQSYQNQQCNLNPLYSTACAGYTAAYQNQQCSADPLYSTSCAGYNTAYQNQQCSIDPLYSTQCSGYNQAYRTQQCSLNPLYSTACAGYAAAYLDQQCNANPLYSTTCSGYATAYQNQQCSANPLYATNCPGYTAAYKAQQCSLNSLYATDCPGYNAAYFNQQCTANPLYNQDCAGYGAAYHAQQCRANPLTASDCNGYQAAFFTQQCSANSLYSANCPGYQVAYKAQQCSLNPLYATDCPGWAQADLNAQCIQNSLYSTQCEGYKTAYAIKYLTPAITSDVAAAVNSTLTGIVETQRNDPATAGITDTNVAAVISSSSTANSTTSTTSISPVAVISTVRPAPAPMSAMAQAGPREDKRDEGAKKNENSNTSNTASSDTKPNSQPTARQALAERRRDAAVKEAVAKGGELAKEMGKAADMEAQKAVQNVVIQAMGFTPGFDTYNKAMIPDTTFYKPFTVYGNQKVIDNRAVSRGLTGGSDKTHQEMVDSQYNRGN